MAEYKCKMPGSGISMPTGKGEIISWSKASAHPLSSGEMVKRGWKKGFARWVDNKLYLQKEAGKGNFAIYYKIVG